MSDSKGGDAGQKRTPGPNACQTCGRDNPVWFAANEVWNAVIPGRIGFICPICFIERAETRGFVSTGWQLVPENSVPVSAPVPERTNEESPLTLQAVLKELDYCGIHFDTELAAEGAGWESAAEPEPQYFETLREAIGFQISLTELAAPVPEPERPDDKCICICKRENHLFGRMCELCNCEKFTLDAPEPPARKDELTAAELGQQYVKEMAENIRVNVGAEKAARKDELGTEITPWYVWRKLCNEGRIKLSRDERFNENQWDAVRLLAKEFANATPVAPQASPEAPAKEKK